MLTALIADDEPLARAHLRRLLEQQAVTVIGEAEGAAQAVMNAEDLKPDLLFLDIQMPGLTGMQIAAALRHVERPPLVIFVTGFSEHAVAAFEHDALDYLVKPVSPDRLAKTLVRARARLRSETDRQRAEDQVTEQSANEGPMKRLPVREDYAVKLLRVEEIVTAVARDKRVVIRTAAGEHRTYYTLTELESLLPADQFLRIHDSVIVRQDCIDELLFLGNHQYSVRLTDGVTLPVGRSRYARLQERFGLTGS